MLPIDYATLFRTCNLTADATKLGQLDFICNNALVHQSLYQDVERECYVPWPVVAAIHFRESNQNFACHLHNGDPLTARTVLVPAGRPIDGKPPFEWAESAVDALIGRWGPKAWDLPGCLQFLERYNGLGYQKHGVNTPYLWDYTDKYVSGLYRADGIFDPLLTESRPGAVAILKTLQAKGISLVFTGMDSKNAVVH